MNDGHKIRVLIAKPGLDGHERGARIVAYGLRDAGFEVIYTGLRQSPEMIVNSAIQEDVNVIGLSILSGSHISITKKVLELLKSYEAEDIIVLVGGIIPKEDINKLKTMGVKEVFTSGTQLSEISNYITSAIIN
jgi:methylmalonyl-CoA mutase C-terminal domain/subunit